MAVKIEKSWGEALASEFEKAYFQKLIEFVKSEYQNHSVYPKGKDIFRAFDKCPLDHVKVVILGQDPYHGLGQANGLCFSVHEGTPFPPSLVNIFKEIKEDLAKEIPPHGSLDRWAEQGVLLLNATLTVRAHQAGSHQKKGWEEFTDAVIRVLAERKTELLICFGVVMHRKRSIVNTSENLVLKSVHPSPLSAYRGFFGSKHFSQANAYLTQHGLDEINW